MRVLERDRVRGRVRMRKRGGVTLSSMVVLA